MQKFFGEYQQENFFDEMSMAAARCARTTPSCSNASTKMDRSEFERKRTLADTSFLSQGVTFTVYNDNQGTETHFPF